MISSNGLSRTVHAREKDELHKRVISMNRSLHPPMSCQLPGCLDTGGA